MCERSSARLPFPDERAVFEEFREINPTGDLRNALTTLLKSVLTSTSETDFTNRDVRIVERSLFFESVIGAVDDLYSPVLRAISSCLQYGVPIRTFEDPAWERVIDAARGLVKTGYILEALPGDRAIAKAARGLAQRGFAVTVSGGELHLSSAHLQKATAEIQKNLDEAGQFAALTSLFAMLRAAGQYEGGLYLPPRAYSLNEREPSLPLNFLLNLAVRSPVLAVTPGNAAEKLMEAFILAQQTAAVIDVESYNMFEGLFTGPRDIEAFLRKMAVYDHLFTFRQWPPAHTSFLLREFFGAGLSEVIKEKLGWGIDSVIALYEVCAEHAKTDPAAISQSDLGRTGLSKATLEELLPYFSHSPGAVNARYASPLHATEADLIFKPLLKTNGDRYVVPALPTASYSFFEATLKPIYARKLVDLGKLSELVGAGTEGIVAGLLARSGILPTFRAAQYRSANDNGECDFVLESERVIVLMECKSKPLTRASMAGVPGDALIDFAGGLLESQKQALRHERILRTDGKINFENGSTLEWRSRKILRMSVTLMDLGALEDKLTFYNLYDTLRSAEVRYGPTYKKTKQIDELNSCLNEFRTETERIVDLGEDIRRQMMRTLSLSVGHLAVLLDGVTSLDHFIARMPTQVSMGSRNPLIEFFRLRRLGIAK